MKKYKIAVLGAGMVGRAIARDLAKDCEVMSADLSASNLDALKDDRINRIQADLAEPETVGRIVAGCDLAVNAMPGAIGFSVLERMIDAGRKVVDISFFAEDPFLLDWKAREKGIVAAVDCGVAPGLSNIILGYHAGRMEVERFKCYVGGLPVVREFPFEYKAPFSPSDVIEEYMRPARIVEDGRQVIRPALSDPELLFFEGVGTLEAFNTDGLRTLLKTMDVPNMVEKTLRYPGHIGLIRALKEAGFLDREPLRFGEGMMRPLDFTSQVLFKKWKLEEEDDEFTIMLIHIEGKTGGHEEQVTYEILDRKDPITGNSSMARTTGFTASSVARLILQDKIGGPGVVAPEHIGACGECFDFIVAELAARNVNIRRKVNV